MRGFVPGLPRACPLSARVGRVRRAPNHNVADFTRHCDAVTAWRGPARLGSTLALILQLKFLHTVAALPLRACRRRRREAAGQALCESVIRVGLINGLCPRRPATTVAPCTALHCIPCCRTCEFISARGVAGRGNSNQPPGGETRALPRPGSQPATARVARQAGPNGRSLWPAVPRHCGAPACGPACGPAPSRRGRAGLGAAVIRSGRPS